MFKFLRKYNKIILAVGGTLLLIVFLIPQAIQGLSQQAARRSADIATVGMNNEDVSIDEWSRVQAETQLIEQFQRNMAQAQQQQMLFPLIGRVDEPGHWYLLTREADELGLVAPRPYSASAENLRRAAAEFGMSEQGVLRTFAKIEGVNNLTRQYLRAGELSDRRLKHFAQRLFHGVGVQTVVIAADADHVEYTPTEQELQEQLDAYRDVLPGEGEHGFGYKLPDRVKIEWLAVPADTVRDVVTDSDAMSSRHLRRYWRENEGERGLPKVEDGVAVPDIVREDMLEAKTSETLDLIAKFAYDQTRIPQRELTRSGGFYVIPDDWPQRRVHFDELAGQLQQRFEIPTPAYHSTGNEWMPVGELSELEGIGQATTQKFGAVATNLVQIVSRAKSLGGTGTIPMQAGVAGPPLRGPDGTVYLFRLLATDPSRPPKSVDEVRDQLVTDLRKLHDYDQLKQRLSEIEQRARTEGLLPLALDFETELNASKHIALYDPNKYRIDSMMNRGLSAQPSPVPGLGQAPNVLEEIIDWAMQFPADADLSELPAEQRTRVFPVDDRLTLLVVRLTSQRPLTEEDFTKLNTGGMLMSLVLGEETNHVKDIQEAFSFEALAKRHNFKFLRRDETDNAGDADADESSDEA